MRTQPEAARVERGPITEVARFALGMAALLERQGFTVAAAELRRLHAQIAACEPYLKEGETPAERIERDHRDSLALMTLLAREKTKNEAMLEALKQIEPILARMYGPQAAELPPMQIVRAAIAKAEAA